MDTGKSLFASRGFEPVDLCYAGVAAMLHQLSYELMNHSPGSIGISRQAWHDFLCKPVSLGKRREQGKKNAQGNLLNVSIKGQQKVHR